MARTGGLQAAAPIAPAGPRRADPAPSTGAARRGAADVIWLHARAPVTRVLLVALGGAAGSVLRYGVAEMTVRLLGSGFPVGTLLVNVLGSTLIAFVAGLDPADDLRLFLTTGVLGGFTTYSTFNQATIAYLQQGAWAPACWNIALTVPLCLLGGVVGAVLARALTGG